MNKSIIININIIKYGILLILNIKIKNRNIPQWGIMDSNSEIFIILLLTHLEYFYFSSLIK